MQIQMAHIVHNKGYLSTACKGYLVVSRDDNGAGLFGYSPRPAPHGTGFNFNKRIWEFFFKLGTGLGIALPARLYIKFNLKFNLIYNLKLI